MTVKLARLSLESWEAMAMGMEYIFFQAHNKKELCGAEAMAQSVKHLLGKHESLRSGPRTHA